ncbi:MAG: hypothetical protein HY562_06380 [Ignavibacteriales bacterium]|nr:hypothetical protein [Ignavibacteriales bacterium]
MNSGPTGLASVHRIQREQPLLFDISDRVLLSLKGPDALDFLHRISTNDILKLKAGASTQTILTNEKGRIVEVVSVIRLDHDELLLAGSSTDDDRIIRWVNKFIIMEDVRVVSVKTSYKQLLLAFDNSLPSYELVHPGSFPIYEVKENWGSIVWTRLVVSPEVASAASLKNFRCGSDQDFDELRIVNGIPASPNEINESANPHEVNLIHLVDFKKGCYIGQEVISRLDTYEKVQRRLNSFTLSKLPRQLPAPVLQRGHEVGIVTSAVYSSTVGSVIGMGFLNVKNVKSARENTTMELSEDRIGVELRLQK